MTYPALALLLGYLLAEWLEAGGAGQRPPDRAWGWAAAGGGLAGLAAGTALLSLNPELLWPQLLGLALLALLAGLAADRLAARPARIAAAVAQQRLPQPAVGAALGCLLVGSGAAHLGLIHAGYSLLGFAFAVLSAPRLIEKARQLGVSPLHRPLLWVLGALAMDHMG